MQGCKAILFWGLLAGAAVLLASCDDLSGADPALAVSTIQEPACPSASPNAERLPEGLATAYEADQNAPGEVSVAFVLPAPGSVLTGETLEIQLNTQGYALDRRAGRRAWVFVDDQPPRPYDGSTPTLSIPLVELGPQPNGAHVLRAVLVRPWGEVIRQAGAYAEVAVRETESDPVPVIDATPTVVLVAPIGVYPVNDPRDRRILADWVVRGVPVGPDAHRVRVTVDERPFDLSAWQPLWLEGVEDGEHRIAVELVDPEGEVVSGPFAHAERSFVVATAAASRGSP